MNLTIEHQTTKSFILSKRNEDNFHVKLIERLKQELSKSEEAIFVINPSEIRYRYQLINKLLPACNHYFAIKSCPQKVVIDEIKKLNGYFDVASSGELNLLKLSGVDISTCIHTHPIKKATEIEYAIEQGIDTFVIDNEFELEKFSHVKHTIQFMLRLSFSNDEAKINLSSKFGMNPSEALAFIVKARIEGYKIKGVCFHVGSQMPSNKQYLHALKTCRELYDEASHIGIELNTIDIGGGFPFYDSQHVDEMIEFFTPINQYLEKHFAGITCWAEPGRFISTPIATLICQVVGKSIKKEQSNYYLNDGVYGCLSNKIFDFYDMNNLKIVGSKQLRHGNVKSSIIYGPTCDSIDKLSDDAMLPEAEIGDYFVFKNMGAYTIASTTNFNMLGNANVVILDF